MAQRQTTFQVQRCRNIDEDIGYGTKTNVFFVRRCRDIDDNDVLRVTVQK